MKCIRWANTWKFFPPIFCRCTEEPTTDYDGTKVIISKVSTILRKYGCEKLSNSNEAMNVNMHSCKKYRYLYNVCSKNRVVTFVKFIHVDIIPKFYAKLHLN